MQKFKRIFLIVTDSLGIGGDQRAKEFGDQGANTLFHISQTKLLNIPTWKKLGIGNITKIDNFGKLPKPQAYMARINELSNAKDTLAGHWEMMGIYTKIPFPTFTKTGFPQDLLDQLSKAFDDKKIIGNKASSGIAIINELAKEEITNGDLIIYTSADSVLQICAHEKYTGLDNLYRYSKIARKICSSKPEWNVGRIIARPYIGENGNWKRTFNRHDYANKPPHKTILNHLQDQEVEVISVGKINDIFVKQGITMHYPSGSDARGMDVVIDLAMQKNENQFIFVNLVEFDSHYGHRRNPEGYAENINQLDIKLTKLINALNEDDLLLMTSDHGNDPTFPGSDHTRENLPATIYSKAFKAPKVLRDLQGLGTMGNIVAKNFGVQLCETGEDIFDELI